MEERVALAAKEVRVTREIKETRETRVRGGSLPPESCISSKRIQVNITCQPVEYASITQRSGHGTTNGVFGLLWRHQEVTDPPPGTPTAKCQEWPYHRLGGGGLVVDGVGPGDGDWLRRRIGALVQLQAL